MDKVIDVLRALKEDKPYMVITDDLIMQVIEDCMEILINDVRAEIDD